MYKNRHIKNVSNFCTIQEGETLSMRGAGVVHCRVMPMERFTGELESRTVLVCHSYNTDIAWYDNETRTIFVDPDYRNYSRSTSCHFGMFRRWIEETANGKVVADDSNANPHEPNEWIYSW